MLHCTEKTITPCLRYEHVSMQADLNTFLLANGGKPAEFIINGTAIFESIVKSETRLVYLFPGAWVRVISPGHFSICTHKAFQERFEMVILRPAMSEELREANYKAAIQSGMSEESARQLVNRMDSDRERIR